MAKIKNTTGLESGRARSGRAGGNATKKKHGPDFFREIGRKGGKTRSKAVCRYCGGKGYATQMVVVISGHLRKTTIQKNRCPRCK